MNDRPGKHAEGQQYKKRRHKDAITSYDIHGSAAEAQLLDGGADSSTAAGATSSHHRPLCFPGKGSQQLASASQDRQPCVPSLHTLAIIDLGGEAHQDART